ncbi:MAG: hypothetical protein AAB575_01805 [Patescibacteria group bacterium]
MSKKRCPTYSNMLWYVAGVLNDESLKQSITAHLTKCASCVETHKVIQGWAEEDRIVYEKVMQAPWSEIPGMFKTMETNQEGHQYAPIVERCIQEVKTGTPNKQTALELLTRIAKDGPFLPRNVAEKFLSTL